MKYKKRYPEVDIRKQEKQGPMPAGYKVTEANGQEYMITEKELHEQYVPVSVVTELPKADMIRELAQTIIDSEIMIDDDNAEILLHDAVEAASAIKKLL